MRKSIYLACLLLPVVFAGCMRHLGTNIQMIVLHTAATGEDGRQHSQMIEFFRDGRAERIIKVDGHLNEADSVTREAARISTDSFERLARTVEDNNFFAKQEFQGDGNADPSITAIDVSTSDGTKSLNVDTNDPQIRNIIAALQKQAGQIEWKPKQPS